VGSVALGGPDATTLFMMAADFSVPASVMGSGVRTGQVVMAQALATGAGWR